MFQLWKFVLLCGLLTGTSANVVEKLTEAVKHGIDDVEPLVQGVLENIQKVAQDLGTKGSETYKAIEKVIQDIPDAIRSIPEVLNKALGKLASKLPASGLKISNVRILAMNAQKNPEGNGVLLRISTGAEVTLILPVIKQTVKLNASLDVMATLEIETDSKSGESRVVMTDCTSDPNSISMSFKGKNNELANKLAGGLSEFLGKTVAFVVQNQICTLMRLLASSFDVKFIQNIIDNGQPGQEVPLIA
uniref:BPI fold containing family A member 2 n=1 Tax=Pipistrellus kuhlii TaxID=59472 RepID=A0A7J7Y7E1_PIPKU|nr:BPI fold containing family A member 2 [Pipistrellus kuhlii]